MMMSVALQGENVTFDRGGGPWSDWKALCCLPSVRVGMEGRVAAGGLLRTELAIPHFPNWFLKFAGRRCCPIILSSLEAEDLPLRWGNGEVNG